MTFNVKDYKGNVIYCEYIINNIDKLGLSLNTPAEVQYVANKYVEKVNETRGYDSDKLYENDEMLIEVAQKAIRKFESLKKGIKRTTVEEYDINAKLQEAKEAAYDINQDKIEHEIDIKLAKEKKMNKKGGHAYSEEYDDYGYDEMYDETVKRRK